MIARYCDRCGELISSKKTRYGVVFERYDNHTARLSIESKAFDLCDKCYKQITRSINGYRDEKEENKTDGN